MHRNQHGVQIIQRFYKCFPHHIKPERRGERAHHCEGSSIIITRIRKMKAVSVFSKSMNSTAEVMDLPLTFARRLAHFDGDLVIVFSPPSLTSSTVVSSILLFPF